MNTFLLTWNPKRWDKWDGLPKESNKTAQGEIVEGRWSCGVTKKIQPGDRCFLMMVGTDERGIIASGWITSEPFYDEHWEKAKAVAGQQSLFVECEWERLLNPEIDSPLLVTTLRKEFSSFNWTPQGSGIRIPEDLVDGLERIWANHVGTSSLGSVGADEDLSAMEGEPRIAMIRHRRREQKLRAAKVQAALKAGDGRLRCEVPGCGFDFLEVYGEPGREFAHVHHLKPLGDRTTPSATKLSDLVIVCVNCHAMIHRGGACRPLEQLIP